ncbi:hypothetical protein JW906_00520 [bacterium]|nr:hypothetical protein [bacterium]
MCNRLLSRCAWMEAVLSLFLFCLLAFFYGKSQNISQQDRELTQPVCQGAMAGTEWEPAAMNTFLSCLDALREHSDEKMAALLSRGRNRGDIPAWLAAHGWNLLCSCRPGAVLFTGSLRDTLASWYQQYVHHFRPDVTIIPIGLLDRAGFLEAFKQKCGMTPEPYWPQLKRPAAGCRGSAPFRDHHVSIHPRTRQHASDPPLLRKSGNATAAVFPLDPGSLSGRCERPAYSDGSVLAMRTLIQANWPDRPVQFSMDCDHEWLYNRREQLQSSGLTLALNPDGVQSADGIPLDREIEDLFLNEERMGPIARACRLNPDVMRSIGHDYIACYRALADPLLGRGLPDRACALLQKMNDWFAGGMILMPEIR